MSANNIVKAIADYKNFDWKKLQRVWYKLERLSDTPQDPKFHAEGDVGIHTKMVVESLHDLFQDSGLNKREREIVHTAAVLHDIAKPDTTQEIKGEIRSPGHSKLGEKIARELLSQSDYFDYDEREQICKLVRYHGLPLWLLDKRDMHRQVAKTSILCNNYLLYLLAMSDIEGRECDDKDDFIDRVNLFEDYCLDEDCLYNPKRFENGLHRFEFFNKHKEYHYKPYDDLGSTVYVMVGLPGSGKDTYIDNNLSNLPEISLDDLREEMGIDHDDEQGRVIQEAKKRAKTFLAHEEDFVWNSTNTTKMIRDGLRKIFIDYNARIHVIYINTTLKQAQQQNEERHYKDQVPSSIIASLYRSLDPPTVLECHDLTIVNND